MPKIKKSVLGKLSQRENSSTGKVYYPEVIPDTLTPELERLSRKAKVREYNERIEEIKNIHSIKQQQIQDAKEDKDTHAINTIIKWVESGKRTIPYLYFNFCFEEQQEFRLFLDKLKNAGCFNSWSTNPFKDAYHSEFIFNNVNIPLLQQFRDTGKIIQFLPGQTVMYQNKVLFFKLGDGTPDSVNFSNAPTEQKVFECFWNLRLRNPGETEFALDEVVNMYIKLYKNLPDVPISRTCSNIRKRYKAKDLLSDRFILMFDNKKKKWIFDVR